MDARIIKVALVACAVASMGATQRTKNFVVSAPTDQIARQVADTAERCREELAIAWLGKTLPSWYRPCKVTVKVGNIGAGGATTFKFDRGEVFDWQMNIQGSLERLLDSVVPHEVSHTIFATHFRRPLPRWADEGAATLVEHESERRRQQLLCQQVLQTSRRIPLKDLLSMKEYPRDMQNVLTLYAEGYSLADFLVQSGGRARYLAFLQEAHVQGWNKAIESHYGIDGIAALEEKWKGWIVAGSPTFGRDDDTQLADAGSTDDTDRRPRNEPLIFRGQTPDVQPAAAAKPARTPVIPLPRTDLSRNETHGSALEEARDASSDAVADDDRSALDGRTGEANAGWQIVDTPGQRRRPRPAPLVMRIEFNEDQSDDASPDRDSGQRRGVREQSTASTVPFSP
jgi:hypothetical protein